MLDVLKEQMRVDGTTDIIMEAAQGQDIRDVFLDNLDTVTLGAENDPEITAIIAKIPMYEDSDPAFAKELEAITESTLLIQE